MTITFTNDRGNPPGKLADAEVHFAGGPIDGLKLVGFAVWDVSGALNATLSGTATRDSANGSAR